VDKPIVSMNNNNITRTSRHDLLLPSELMYMHFHQVIILRPTARGTKYSWVH